MKRESSEVNISDDPKVEAKAMCDDLLKFLPTCGDDLGSNNKLNNIIREHVMNLARNPVKEQWLSGLRQIINSGSPNKLRCISLCKLLFYVTTHRCLEIENQEVKVVETLVSARGLTSARRSSSGDTSITKYKKKLSEFILSDEEYTSDDLYLKMLEISGELDVDDKDMMLHFLDTVIASDDEHSIIKQMFEEPVVSILKLYTQGSVTEPSGTSESSRRNIEHQTVMCNVLTEFVHLHVDKLKNISLLFFIKCIKNNILSVEVLKDWNSDKSDNSDIKTKIDIYIDQVLQR